MTGRMALSPKVLLGPSRTALEILLVIALAALLARSVWLVLSPESVVPVMASPVSGTSGTGATLQGTPVDRNILVGTNMFARTAPEPKANADDLLSAPETSLNLTLVGSRANALDGRSGSATIIIPNGEQKLVFVGGEVIEGVELERVFNGRVAIRSRGQLETLSLRENRERAFLSVEEPGAVAPDPPSPGPAAQEVRIVPGQVSARKLLAENALSPVRDDYGVWGYRITPLGNSTSLANVGLQGGDIIVEINGELVADIDAAELNRMFLNVNTVELSADRGGEPVDLSITFAEES